MSAIQGCYVACKRTPQNPTVVNARHYADLKRRLRDHESGWVELDSIYGDGRALIRLDDIVDLFLATESYAEERDKADALERMLNGEPNNE